MLLTGYMIGVLYRFILKRFNNNKSKKQITSKNIGSSDRFFRLFIAVVLFVFGMFNPSNPIFFIASGFCIYEAFASWCAFYSFIGKNTCPIN